MLLQGQLSAAHHLTILTDWNDIFLKVEPVGYFYGTSIDSVQNAVLFIEQFPSKTAKFILALELADGYLLLDHISLTEIL